MGNAYSNDFGMILQELRKKQGLKQEQLADIAFVNKNLSHSANKKLSQF